MVETIDYSVIRTVGRVEIRLYPRTTLATVAHTPDDEAFGMLFSYIAGDNSEGVSISMTAPVISTDDAFSFVMPHELSLTSIPKPNNPRVSMADIPGRTVAVMRFRGRTPKRKVEAKELELLRSLDPSEVTVTGKPFLMRYNPPFVPGFLRRNEVGVDIEVREEGARE